MHVGLPLVNADYAVLPVVVGSSVDSVVVVAASENNTYSNTLSV